MVSGCVVYNYRQRVLLLYLGVVAWTPEALIPRKPITGCMGIIFAALLVVLVMNRWFFFTLQKRKETPIELMETIN